MLPALVYGIAFNLGLFALALGARVAFGPVAAGGVVGFCLGAAVGSFLNLAAYRVAAGVPLSGPPSHCPRCGVAIRPYHNVPVLGWLGLRGRCASCGAAIPARYLLAELAAGAAGAGLGAGVGAWLV